MNNIKHIMEYNKKNQKRVMLAFYPSEHQLYEWLHNKPNMSGFIKQLIIAEYEKENKK